MNIPCFLSLDVASRSYIVVAGFGVILPTYRFFLGWYGLIRRVLLDYEHWYLTG